MFNVHLKARATPFFVSIKPSFWCCMQGRQTKNAFKAALAALKRELGALNLDLASNTFLVEHSVTLADIVMTFNLYFGFTRIMTKSFTSEFPHVERDFWTLVNQPKKICGWIPLPSGHLFLSFSHSSLTCITTLTHGPIKKNSNCIMPRTRLAPYLHRRQARLYTTSCTKTPQTVNTSFARRRQIHKPPKSALQLEISD